MTQYVLHISDYSSTVPWARHFHGRVEGPHPESCHGGTIYHGQAGPLQGKKTCAEGHELPEQVRWDVEAAWTEKRRERWAAESFEGQGPRQFDTKAEVLDRAMIQFLDGSEYPCEEVSPAEEGDELWYGWVGDDERFADAQDPSDGWGMMIARKDTGPATPADPPAAAATPEPVP